MGDRSLPNHFSQIRDDVDPRAPSSKIIRADMGPYPGGVPGITPQYLNNDRRVNKTVGWRTNGAIRTTVETRARDQNFINVNQLAFMDTNVPDRPQLYNIQQLNWWLVSEFPELMKKNKTMFREWSVKNRRGKTVNRTQAEKAYIMKRFKLYGAVVNRDVDNGDDMAIERIPRAFTCTVKGVCHILDYWSTADRRLNAYDTCYFVLKKVVVGPETRYQSRLTTTVHEAGQPVPSPWPREGRMVWQVVPFNTSDNFIPVEKYTFVDKESRNGDLIDTRTEIGGYWRVGSIHEYPDIGHKSIFKKRDEHAVARDITYLHDNGRIVPIHFYLHLDDNCK